MRLWYLSYTCRRPAKAQASLRIRAVSPEPSLFARMKYGKRQRVRPKIRDLAPLDELAQIFSCLRCFGYNTSVLQKRVLKKHSMFGHSNMIVFLKGQNIQKESRVYLYVTWMYV